MYYDYMIAILISAIIILALFLEIDQNDWEDISGNKTMYQASLDNHLFVPSKTDSESELSKSRDTLKDSSTLTGKCNIT